MHISDQQLLLNRWMVNFPRGMRRWWLASGRMLDVPYATAGMENAIADYVRLPKPQLPPAQGPRALLMARWPKWSERIWRKTGGLRRRSARCSSPA